MSLSELPSDLPVPEDDGAADHLTGLSLPPVTLAATSGGTIDMSRLNGRWVLYIYPMTGRPDRELPDGWDGIPGARGCTPQTCAFRDHYGELQALGAGVYGISSQPTEYQREMVERLHVPFPVLSDSDYALADTLGLPSFEAEGERLLKRLTLLVKDGVIDHVFYPVFPPDRNADDVLDWLKSR